MGAKHMPSMSSVGNYQRSLPRAAVVTDTVNYGAAARKPPLPFPIAASVARARVPEPHKCTAQRGGQVLHGGPPPPPPPPGSLSSRTPSGKGRFP
ncbi:hypothetical protein MSG28_008622 [Choristoneura fumiferana]|uniref:Uncharacterized protein n=1 Tax=Choristoneura fumiferana TaxID=7141 RepID=A0ACC0J7E4_CHOFU|nr:hypothetical protein MSG28_008622 [Choristoneura fumiferana]